MKKIISLLLAVLMAFSVCTIAFATGEPASTTAAAEDNTTTDSADEGEGDIDLGSVDWILDLPFWTVKPASKIAKIAIKLIKVYLKVGKIFGIVDKDADDYIMEFIADFLDESLNSDETTTAPTTTVVAPSATTVAA